ncbi:cytochrome C oxidase subunit IV family protein [Flavobacteriaceae bacterium S0825]|uniref:cytochrome C oxidase subunit IV family protein n=1 Tax=Gaetbulibacter sp. S0825 TaxID=2720084 RepID=UPI0014318F0F|nr:cytochrome C oxidase subunit IV family protein [Gaetbulibacter sp. S0825]MCK0107722.1 cytochrome C oxidase subunit IV family protein [Flavobacteriaceae bacterium S0825]NIX63358.1 hypothetical protein [Gaetbulibacter sp. S0825]
MKKLLITLGVLIILTIVTAIISSANESFTVVAILILAVLKFIGVSFYFMEMKKAHVFWKASVLIFLLLFTTIILLQF